MNLNFPREPQYRPETLDEFETINASIAQTLKAIVKRGDCPHTLFYGPSGSGTSMMTVTFRERSSTTTLGTRAAHHVNICNRQEDADLGNAPGAVRAGGVESARGGQAVEDLPAVGIDKGD